MKKKLIIFYFYQNQEKFVNKNKLFIMNYMIDNRLKYHFLNNQIVQINVNKPYIFVVD